MSDPRLFPVFSEIAYFIGPVERILSRLRNPRNTQMIVIISGTYRAYTDLADRRINIVAQSGDVVCWPTNVERTEESQDGNPVHAINFLFEDPPPREPLPFLVHDRDQIIYRLSERMLDISHRMEDTDANKAALDSYLAAILTEYHFLCRIGNKDLAGRVAEYVEKYMRQPVTITALARHVGLEKHHFGRKYKQQTGRTPLQDVLHRKAVFARDLLRQNPRWTLETIAPLVGLNDVPSLSRLLSRYAGVSAREIKRTAKARKNDNSRHPPGPGL